jgi:Tat protein secretion system quality control protein TatD with DNase activity
MTTPKNTVAILGRAEVTALGAFISAGTTVASSRRSIELSACFPGFFSGVGIHPMDIKEPFVDDAQRPWHWGC